MKKIIYLLCFAICSFSCTAQQATLNKNANGSTVLFSNGDPSSTVRITKDGKVSIGQPNPKDKLEVNGQIHAKAVQVDLKNWADYVFTSEYTLMDLQTLAAYIKEHGHLPGVPNADTVVQEGINLGEMNTILLEKIEELTLHLITKEQQVNTLTQRLDQLEAQVAQLVKDTKN